MHVVRVSKVVQSEDYRYCEKRYGELCSIMNWYEIHIGSRLDDYFSKRVADFIRSVYSKRINVNDLELEFDSNGDRRGVNVKVMFNGEDFLSCRTVAFGSRFDGLEIHDALLGLRGRRLVVYSPSSVSVSFRVLYCGACSPSSVEMYDSVVCCVDRNTFIRVLEKLIGINAYMFSNFVNIPLEFAVNANEAKIIVKGFNKKYFWEFRNGCPIRRGRVRDKGAVRVGVTYYNDDWRVFVSVKYDDGVTAEYTPNIGELQRLCNNAGHVGRDITLRNVLEWTRNHQDVLGRIFVGNDKLVEELIENTVVVNGGRLRFIEPHLVWFSRSSDYTSFMEKFLVRLCIKKTNCDEEYCRRAITQASSPLLSGCRFQASTS